MAFSSTHNLAQTQFENLMRAYGSPNYGTQRSLCFNAMIMAGLMTYGLEEPGRDYDNARYIIYAGRNLMEAISNSETQDLVAAISRGVKVVLLDPRFTVTASKATEWLPVRPGTDLAFFLALLNVIIAEKRYDEAFVNKYTVGFDQLQKEVAQYTPDWAAPICGIEAERIRRIAREFSDVRPNCFAHPELAHEQLCQHVPGRARDFDPQRADGQLEQAGRDCSRQPAKATSRWARCRSRRTRASTQRGSTACPTNIRSCH